ncbi:radical SAM family heme chaperone HemW [Pontixanthobacter aestiaquae]|uniref:Heme chaperone HemW n=1 Tax=Pontixanthobacter aestiaquae TaxID=1509367 RepID=A0A844ZCM7_9SPHN|nr:radical SAM family heme chaperone HemW [Pontixanthobacter aestiaquae]MDN3645431.1 radical SAM family heme chaperone HemW [Pontixanthobacter aestiaquae]MXO83569.1 coproporphyrinogen III oxidase [Pontixanthobacter aestiaquae]
MARALYIHWPFCLKKCPYCDFNSHVRDTVDHTAWEAPMLRDMEHEAKFAGGEALESIFFGGGTPSLMPPALVGSLLDHAEKLWGFAPGIEITLEANPSSVEAANFADLTNAGVNRVSLGLQSLHDDALKFLGRLHSVEEGLAALDVAQRHFGRVSFDLIYALPDQTEKAWAYDLERALSFGTDHLSLYQLTIEPNTRFATDVRRGVFDPLDDDPAADLFEVTRQLTEDAGMPAYEVSNHAKPGQESRHNLTYWRYQDYCGIGPGAHGRRNNQATLRHKKPENWLVSVNESGSGLREERALTRSEQASEALLMGLRLAEGISLPDISTRFDLAFTDLVDEDRLRMLNDLGFVWQSNERLGVTPRGMPVLDALLGELVNAELVMA